MRAAAASPATNHRDCVRTALAYAAARMSTAWDPQRLGFEGLREPVVVRVVEAGPPDQRLEDRAAVAVHEPDSSADGGTVAGSGEPPAAARREIAPGSVSPAMPNPCELYWRVAWQVLASAYGNRDMARPEPMAVGGVLVVVVVDNDMRDAFARAFYSDQLVRESPAAAKACVQVVVASQTGPSVQPEQAPAGSALGGAAGSQPAAVPSGARAGVGVTPTQAATASSSTSAAPGAACPSCGCALALLDREGQAKTPEGVERQIEYLWNAAHNMVIGGRRLTDGLDKSSRDRKKLAMELIERCRAIVSGSRGAGGQGAASGPLEPGMRGKAIELVSSFPGGGTTPEGIENTKSTFRREVQLTRERMEQLRVRVGTPAVALAEMRAEYDALLKNPSADPKRKEELRRALSFETIVEVDARAYIVARLDLEIEHLKRLEEWIANLDTARPLSRAELRAHFDFYDMLLRFENAACDHAELLARALEEVELARITIADQEHRIFAPITIAEWALPGGSSTPGREKPAFSPPSNAFVAESPLAASVRAQFEAFRDAPRPGGYYANADRAALLEGRGDLQKYEADIKTHGQKFEKESAAEWSRINKGYRGVVANILDIATLYEFGVGAARAAPTVAALLKAAPAASLAAIRKAGRGLRTLATNPRAVLRGGYQALVDAIKRGYRFGIEEEAEAAARTTVRGRPRPSGPQARSPDGTATEGGAGPGGTGNRSGTEFRERYLGRSGGRWGSSTTRQLNDEIATALEKEFPGCRVRGDARSSEEWIPGPGGGKDGGTFVDITVTRGSRTIRVQTIDTFGDGVTPTPREAAAAARIRAQFPGDELRLIPKPK